MENQKSCVFVWFGQKSISERIYPFLAPTVPTAQYISSPVSHELVSKVDVSIQSAMHILCIAGPDKKHVTVG